MDIGEIMKQAGAMQAKMQEMQEKLAEIEVTGEAGGGMVKVVLNGKGLCEGRRDRTLNGQGRRRRDT